MLPHDDRIDLPRKDVENWLSEWLRKGTRYNVLIISYETFRLHSDKLEKHDHACDMLICDEAHRLKNADALTTRSLNSLKCRRRVLLSGTPVQNDLEEFFAMVDFANPGIFGTKEEFRRKYQSPLLRGREPDATEKVKAKAAQRQQEMSEIVNHFILRRMNTLNAKQLPPKLVQIVCCPLTDTQQNIYKYLIDNKESQHMRDGRAKDTLGYIQQLQKCCNHPQLLLEGGEGKERAGMSKSEVLSPGTQHEVAFSMGIKTRLLTNMR